MPDFDDLSPAEQIVEQAAPPSLQRDSGTLNSHGEPIRPWTPTGVEQPQETVRPADDLTMSPPPPKTAGGSPPATRKPLGQTGPDE